MSLGDFDPTKLIDSFSKMSFQARNLSRAARIYESMLKDRECSIWLCLAGSLFSAGLKKVAIEMVEKGMVDVIVSTGAIVVDQDFFEALGFAHYAGNPQESDKSLYEASVDRIYDTYISEDELRECDDKVSEIADSIEPGRYSSRKFIDIMGAYLQRERPEADSLILECHKRGVPVFVPALSDCSAGFGIGAHQHRRKDSDYVSIDSVSDFRELARIKSWEENTGLYMVGGGVPKNFAQDASVATAIFGSEASMHKYAIQITVADERDGALSGSTLKEAHSWGKVGSTNEQMVFCEATIAMPLISGFAYHSPNWEPRREKAYNKRLDSKDDTQ